MLIEVTVDGPNSLTSFRPNILDLEEIITLRYLNELIHSSYSHCLFGIYMCIH